MREVAEGAGHRLFDDHFAELAHDHEGDETADGVAENHRRASGFEYTGRAEEQAGTNRATEGDQLNMTILQAAFQLACLRDLPTHEKSPTFSVFTTVMRHLFVFICDEIEPGTLVTWRSEQGG